MPKPKQPKLKSHKGKRHPAHAASFGRIANDLRLEGYRDIADIFDKEVNRLRAVVR